MSFAWHCNGFCRPGDSDFGKSGRFSTVSGFGALEEIGVDSDGQPWDRVAGKAAEEALQRDEATSEEDVGLSDTSDTDISKVKGLPQIRGGEGGYSKSVSLDEDGLAKDGLAYHDRDELRRNHVRLKVTDTMGAVPSSALQLIINNPGKIHDYYNIAKKPLGKGAYGVVTVGHVKATEAARAVKSILKAGMKDHLAALKYEIEIMKRLDHPYIVMLFEIFEDRDHIYLVMELCSGGHLQHYVDNRGHLTEANAAAVMQQVCRAVFYLHRNSVCHRDLKSENLLLSTIAPLNAAGTNSLKVADFGMSTFFQPNLMLNAVVGTPSHMAPEVVARCYNQNCDYWAVGVVMYYIMCGVEPFDPKSSEPKRFTIDFKSLVWVSVSEDAITLVQGLLCKSVEHRVTACSALQHPWMLNHGPKPPEALLKPEVLDSLCRFRSENRFKRASLSVIASLLDEKVVAPSRKLFMALDESGDGLISFAELSAKLGEEAAKVILARGDGRTVKQKDFAFLEFVAATFDRRRCCTQDVCKTAFSVFDKDGNGSISLLELSSGKMLGKMSAKELSATLQALDKNGDQEIDFKEFMQNMRNV